MTRNLITIGFLAIAVAMQPLHLPAAEEADAPEVKIYGRAHVAVEYHDNGDEANVHISSNSSRIGFKGSKELDYGLTGIWQLEQTISLDESGGDLATRNSFLGLQCAAGTVKIGRHCAPMKMLGRKADLFGCQIGDSRNIIGISNCGCDLRLDNVLLYTTPNLAGAQAAVAYTAGDEADDAEVVSASLVYTRNGLLVGAAYEQHGEGIAGTDTDGDGVIDTDKGENAIRVAAAVKAGSAKVTGLYETIGDINGVSGDDRDAWGLGAAFTVGKTTIKGQYYSTDGVDGDGSAMYALGVEHKLSKKTTVYAAFAATSNDDGANARVSSGAHGDKIDPATAGDDPMAAAIGVIHNF